jgi:polyribonucleotide nucleotidyltransferase
MNKVITKEIDLHGRKLKLETGKLAFQADAAVVATLGETVVLATVSTKPITIDPGYFPLSVEYVEKYYAGGRITGQKFIKRETRPSEKAVLSGRAIDRSIRPLFPKDFRAEVQVIINVLSFDGVNDPALLGFVGASAALSISSVPWNGPIGVARIGEKDGTLIVNPEIEDKDHLSLELTVSATSSKIVMIEAEAKQTPDELMFEAIQKGFEENQVIVKLVSDFAKEAKKEKLIFTKLEDQVEAAILKEAKELARKKVEEALFSKIRTFHSDVEDEIKAELIEKYTETLTPIQVAAIYEKVAKEIMNDTVLNKGKRVDGRGMEDIREIFMETGVLPRTHGSAIFQRGESQVLCIATLGPMSASQTLEGMEGESSKRFMHHYNMGINPFSSGEVKRIGPPSRRDIGHGDLGEKSMRNVIPSEDEFPYAIRVVSEILSANASTSQAAISGSSLALLNAGVPIEPVAGIALGLLSNDKKFQVITDMQATEDFYGEMDFKVAGTKNGITGIQMDTKLEGLTFEIIQEALRQGKKAREVILQKMHETAPEELEISKYAPKIEVTHIKPEEIGMLIGPGGKNINGIIARTGAQIDIEDDGTVMISSMDENSIKQAMEAVEGMFKKVEVGEEYDGKVVRIAPFGAFVQILPGKDGLVHVSQMAPERVEKPEDVVSEGQEVHVRVIDVDSQGKIALSMLFGADIKPDEGRGRRGGGGGSGSGGFRDRGGDRGSSGPRRDFGRSGGAERGAPPFKRNRRNFGR